MSLNESIANFPKNKSQYNHDGSKLRLSLDGRAFLSENEFKEIRARPELNDGKGIIPVRAFHLWLEELQTMEIGKKPPLRLPMKL